MRPRCSARRKARGSCSSRIISARGAAGTRARGSRPRGRRCCSRRSCRSRSRATRLWAVTFWTALGVADGIEAATGLRVGLQWPNDLLLDGRKCCGILCVSRVVGDRAWVGCGTGVNVVRPAADVALDAVVPPPAFLSDAMPGVERRVVLDAILAAYERRLPELASPAAIARAWEARAGLAGTPYRLLIDGATEPIEAIARRIADDGALVVDDGGIERAVSLADARVIR